MDIDYDDDDDLPPSPLLQRASAESRADEQRDELSDSIGLAFERGLIGEQVYSDLQSKFEDIPVGVTDLTRVINAVLLDKTEYQSLEALSDAIRDSYPSP